MYDYLIVGAGLYGCVFAHEATARGKKCLVIDRREHVGGNVYTQNVEGINVHKYGAHIFHTSDSDVWNYINRFCEFNNYINSPIARYRNEIYNLPFNMNTFIKLWSDVVTPDEAQRRIEEQKSELRGKTPTNLEEQAISLVGRDVYEKLIKGYTEKQWGRSCDSLPAFIINRLPLRFTFNNNYFNDRYQGIPIGGYTQIAKKMLEGSDVKLNFDFSQIKNTWQTLAKKLVYTGAIDEFFDFSLGRLEYRTVYFETEVLNCENYQGNAVVNYTEREIPYTRIIEHKHFEDSQSPVTVISKEYPTEWTPELEPYYPINDEKNEKLLASYKKLAVNKNVLFGGRLGDYKYYDMDKVIAKALADVKKEFNE